SRLRNRDRPRREGLAAAQSRKIATVPYIDSSIAERPVAQMLTIKTRSRSDLKNEQRIVPRESRVEGIYHPTRSDFGTHYSKIESKTQIQWALAMRIQSLSK